MKRIEAIIRSETVSAVCAALEAAGHPEVTLSQVAGYGEQKGWVHHVRGAFYTENLLSKTRVEVVVKDEDMDRIITTIRDAALTGKEGDGKIFVHDYGQRDSDQDQRKRHCGALKSLHIL